MRTEDPNLKVLIGIAATLKPEYLTEDLEWEGSPFAWIKTRPSRQRGKIGEQLVAGWLAARGFNVQRSPDADADKIIEGKRVEIKFSTLWRSRSYKFQQLRDQNYQMVICLGISPLDAHCWVLPKSEVLRQWRETGQIRSQHGGTRGKDTAWLQVDPTSVPEWLAPWGGQLRVAVQVLSKVTGFTPSPIR